MLIFNQLLLGLNVRLVCLFPRHKVCSQQVAHFTVLRRIRFLARLQRGFVVLAGTEATTFHLANECETTIWSHCYWAVRYKYNYRNIIKCSHIKVSSFTSNHQTYTLKHLCVHQIHKHKTYETMKIWLKRKFQLQFKVCNRAANRKLDQYQLFVKAVLCFALHMDWLPEYNHSVLNQLHKLHENHKAGDNVETRLIIVTSALQVIDSGALSYCRSHGCGKSLIVN